QITSAADFLWGFEAIPALALLTETHVGRARALDVVFARVGIAETGVFHERARTAADIHGRVLTRTAPLYHRVLEGDPYWVRCAARIARDDTCGAGYVVRELAVVERCSARASKEVDKPADTALVSDGVSAKIAVFHCRSGAH